MQIDHLLVATDLSPASAYAYPFAAGFARAVGARITLLFVDELSRYGLGNSCGAVELLQRARAHEQRHLAEAAARLGSLGVEVEAETVAGVPSEQILDVADRRGVGAIALSMGGSRGLERLLFGSTTRRVLRHSDLPVLVVQLPKTGPLIPPERHVPYRRLMVTTDFGDDSERCLALALALAERIGATVALTHALQALPMPLPADVYGELPHLALGPLRDEATVSLRAQARRHRSSRLSTRLLVGPSVADAIAEDADRSADLIIVASHGRGGLQRSVLGDTAEALLQRAVRPTLVLHRRYLERVAAQWTAEPASAKGGAAGQAA